MDDSKQFHRRSRLLLALFAACLLCFTFLLYDAQVIDQEEYLSRSTTQISRTETVEASRGILTDRNGKVLVSNRQVYTIDFDPALVPESQTEGVTQGQAVALALLRLGRLTAREEYRQAAQRQLAWLAGNLRDYPAGHTFALLALLEDMHPGRELVCTAAEGAPAELTALADRVSALVKTGENSRALARLAPFTADYPVPETGEAYYLCQDGACQEPVHDLASLRRRLGPSGARERPRV